MLLEGCLRPGIACGKESVVLCVGGTTPGQAKIVLDRQAL